MKEEKEKQNEEQQELKPQAKKKKFQPISQKDQTDEQREKVKRILDDWKNHPFVKNYHGKWREYIKWFEGDQYTVYDEDTGDLLDVSPLVERETKNVYNRIMPQVRQLWGELHYPHEFYSFPATNEPEDIKSAHMGSIYIEWSNAEGQFRQKINRAKLWAIITGAVYWKEWWNKNAEVEFRGKDGKKILTEKLGTTDFDFINPFNVRPDPSSLTRKGWRWFMEGTREPKTDTEALFGLEKGTLPSAPNKGEDNTDTGLYEKSETKSDYDEDDVLIIERWERPTDKHPKGRFIKICGTWLLYDGDNPAPKHNIPYFCIPGVVPRLGAPICDSMVRIMQPAQRHFNRYASMIDEHIENFRIKGMIPRNSLRGGELKAWKRSGGIDYVEFDGRFGTPYLQTPPTLSKDILSWLSFQENEIEQESSVRRPLLGQLPERASRPSGVLFSQLVSRDQRPLYPSLDDTDIVLSEIMSFRLELAKQHCDEKRLLRIAGRDNRPMVVEFIGSDLGNNTDIRVKAGVDIFTNKEKKEQVVMALIEKGMIKDPKQALQMLDYKGVEEFAEDEFVDEKQAERHLEIMKEKDIYIKPNEEDNHKVHFRVFNNFRKTEGFDVLDKKRRENILKRIEEHKKLIMAEQQQMAAMQQQASAGGQAQGQAGTMQQPGPETPLSPDEIAKIEQALTGTGGVK